MATPPAQAPARRRVTRDGFVFAIDDLDSLGLAGGADFEADVRQALAHWVRPGATVVDVGANIGYFTAHMARLVGPAGRVHAFEPEPANLDLLAFNVQANGLGQVTVHSVALGQREGVARLHRSNFNGGMHRLYESICCEGEAVEVAVRCLDALFEPGEVALLKLDVEGFEPWVLAGARRLLGDRQLVIVSEYCPASILEAGTLPSEFLQELQARGLHAYTLEGQAVAWEALQADAACYEGYGRDRFFEACAGQDTAGITATIARLAGALGCRRPILENLVLRQP